jgi:hypothetical protein
MEEIEAPEIDELLARDDAEFFAGVEEERRNDWFCGLQSS